MRVAALVVAASILLALGACGGGSSVADESTIEPGASTAAEDNPTANLDKNAAGYWVAGQTDIAYEGRTYADCLQKADENGFVGGTLDGEFIELITFCIGPVEGVGGETYEDAVICFWEHRDLHDDGTFGEWTTEWAGDATVGWTDFCEAAFGE